MEIKTVIEDGKEYKVIISDIGSIGWRLNKEAHREKGPAYFECDGYKVWFQNDLLHRLDGPAVIWPDGRKQWRIYDIRLTEGQHAKVRTILDLGINKI